MNVEVFLTHTTVTEDDVRGRAVVVIDVLRACSTINTALHNGARAVMPVLDMAQASKIAANLDPDVFRLGGERNAEKIEGYHLGNSPLEYTEDEVEGRDVILNTTNGTKALERAKTARHLVAGSFLNVSRTARFLNEQDRDVTIICAGHENRVSLEDTICAGALLYRLWDGTEPDHVSDAAHTAYSLFLYNRDHLDVTLRNTNHARRLTENGYADDVDYCYQIDHIPVLPYYTDNRLVMHEVSSEPVSTPTTAP
ncbi:2-phosphosulfolactate phosphatase [Longimonas halophila]|uniref:Probable 2-phosphosulfolactate phosphatase n=1 Tax=Longimonas halophila TaxID=1469170 RepID=A0A2H3NLB4_9BACT|nr:2-phosphosulfolactate phosphatase [Longimonas halophila]PEN06734.1 2-phosphosulfolactate phosphatase [Longimonas halophila]